MISYHITIETSRQMTHDDLVEYIKQSMFPFSIDDLVEAADNHGQLEIVHRNVQTIITISRIQ